MEIQPRHQSSADGALIARIAEGDEEALGSLYDRHSGSAYSLAYAVARNSADAEEAVADTFLQAWRRASSFDPRRGSVAAWLMTIARSRALDTVRARGRRGRVRREVERMAVDGAGAAWSPATDPPDMADELHARRLAGRLLSELSDEQRRAIELAYLGGMSHSEIAAELGEPLGTVKTRIRTGMQKLREALRPLRVEVGH
jgi:RNA polymerase sigma-70 factor (ECF subfamily)